MQQLHSVPQALLEALPAFIVQSSSFLRKVRWWSCVGAIAWRARWIRWPSGAGWRASTSSTQAGCLFGQESIARALVGHFRPVFQQVLRVWSGGARPYLPSWGKGKTRTSSTWTSVPSSMSVLGVIRLVLQHALRMWSGGARPYLPSWGKGKTRTSSTWISNSSLHLRHFPYCRWVQFVLYFNMFFVCGVGGRDPTFPPGGRGKRA